MLLFGTYLIEKGYLTPEQILHALDEQKKSWVFVGKIALNEGLLTKKQILRILDEQKVTKQLFIDTAISLNFLTEEEGKRILRIQKSNVLPIGQLLVFLGYISQTNLDKELNIFLNKNN